MWRGHARQKCLSGPGDSRSGRHVHDTESGPARRDHMAVLGEVLRDVASTRHIGLAVGPAATGAEIVAMLDRACAQRGGPPLVYSTDNGPQHVSHEVAHWLVEHQVVHLRNAPHTPEHRRTSSWAKASCLARSVKRPARWRARANGPTAAGRGAAASPWTLTRRTSSGMLPSAVNASARACAARRKTLWTASRARVLDDEPSARRSSQPSNGLDWSAEPRAVRLPQPSKEKKPRDHHMRPRTRIAEASSRSDRGPGG